MGTNFSMEESNITMMRGDALSFGLEIQDGEGNPLDVETAYFTSKKTYTDEVTLFQKSLSNGISKDSTGKYIVRVAPEDTAEAEAGKYFYDFQVGLNTDVFTILHGVLEIEPDVTD